MIHANRVLLALVLMLVAAPMAFADGPIYSGIGAGIGMGFAAVGAGIGIGLIGFAALSGIARQPEQAGRIQGAMYVLAALVEGVALVALALCFVISSK